MNNPFTPAVKLGIFAAAVSASNPGGDNAKYFSLRENFNNTTTLMAATDNSISANVGATYDSTTNALVVKAPEAAPAVAQTPAIFNLPANNGPGY